MKKLIILFSLFSSLAYAGEVKQVSFTYFGNSGPNRQFYACDYVEAQAEGFLETFGATRIEVSCTGGIQNYSMSPVSVRAKFELPQVTGSSVDEVVLEGDSFNPNCGINSKIINEFVKMFSTIKIIKKSDSCAFQSSNYSFKLQIQR